jgi:hypothetical protein
LRGTELFTQNGRSHFGKQHNWKSTFLAVI